MAGRILTLQRQVRELGRLRTGYAGPKGPVRSKTWIITSSQRTCLDTAAELWGGKVEEWTPLNGTEKQWRLTTDTNALEALLPPGDPLTQNNEMWNRGGAVRRCNGEVESKSGKPCLCVAAFGDDWYRRKPTEVCRPYSQLNIILPQLPDLGVWRHVTKSFYAAGEIAGMVDLIKAQIGAEVMVPVRLRIDQRKKVADGTTTPYPVPVIEIRGASAGQILAGDVPALSLEGATPGQRAAIGAAPEEALTEARVLELAGLCKNLPQVQALWREAGEAGVLSDSVKAALTERGNTFAPKPSVVAVKPVSGPPAVDAEVEPDADALWSQIVAASPWPKTAELEQRFYAFAGKAPDDANGFDFQRFLDALKNGEVQ